MSKAITVIIPKDSIHQVMASFSLDFIYDNTPLHLDCRILESDTTVRCESQDYDHPSPAFSRVFLFEEGSAVIKTKNKTTKLTSGKIYLLPSNMPFKVNYGKTRMPYLHIFVSDISGHSVFAGQDEILCINDSALFQRLADSINKKNSFKLCADLMETVRSLLHSLLPKLVESSRNSQKFTHLFNWLRNQKTAGVTVEQAAELYGITSSAFSKRFQRTMGISFKEFLTEKQIKEAQQLLIYTEKNISETALALGHSSPQYFQRFFKKHCRSTPNQYREKMRKRRN